MKAFNRAFIKAIYSSVKRSDHANSFTASHQMKAFIVLDFDILATLESALRGRSANDDSME